MKIIKKFINHPLFSGSVIMIGGSMFVNAFNYLYHLLMGRMLGPTDYGTLASIFSVLYIISIVPLSTSVSIVKFTSIAKNKKELANIYGSIKKFMWKIAVVGIISISLLSPFLANFLHIEEYWGVFLSGPILFVSLITLVNQATAQGRLKFFGVVGPNFISSFGKLFIGIALVMFGFSVLGAIWGVLLGVVLAYFYSQYFVRDIKITKTDYDIRPFIKYSMPALIQALSFTSLFTTDLILVKHFLSAHDAGVYAALSTLGKIVFFASSPVTSVMFPIVSKRKALGQNYLKFGVLSFLINASISLVALIPYGFFPELVINGLYGGRYIAPSGSLFLMGAFISVYTSANLLVNYLLSTGNTVSVIIPLISAILQIFAIIIWHESINEVITVSLIISMIMFVSVVLYMVYNLKQKKYAT